LDGLFKNSCRTSLKPGEVEGVILQRHSNDSFQVEVIRDDARTKTGGRTSPKKKNREREKGNYGHESQLPKQKKRKGRHVSDTPRRTFRHETHANDYLMCIFGSATRETIGHNHSRGKSSEKKSIVDVVLLNKCFDEDRFGERG